MQDAPDSACLVLAHGAFPGRHHPQLMMAASIGEEASACFIELREVISTLNSLNREHPTGERQSA